jgi:hypothetical protein
VPFLRFLVRPADAGTRKGFRVLRDTSYRPGHLIQSSSFESRATRSKDACPMNPELRV